MPDLIVTCAELKYAGKTYRQGEHFTAAVKDARLFKAIKKAADAPEIQAPRHVRTMRPTQTRDVVAEQPAETDEPPVLKLKRTYRRRDMQAED